MADCFSLIRQASSSPGRDLIRLLNAVLLNYLISNNDAHGKNFSLLYRVDGGRRIVELAPFYDLVSTASYSEWSPKMAMEIGGQYLPEKLRQNDWERFWESVGFSKKQARKQALQFAELVEAKSKNPQNETEAGIDRLIQKRIRTLWKTMA